MPEASFALLGKTLGALAPGGKMAVAYSGGLDSRFLVHAALREGFSVVALHVNGPHIPSAEHRYALQWASENGVRLEVVQLDPLANPLLRCNPRERCYHCKLTVFEALARAAGRLPLCDGTNASDLGEYRPGLRAIAELGIHSPLAACGLDKAAIRRLAASSGMANPQQAAQPCLLTRFPYGFPLRADLLSAVDAVEEAVGQALAEQGQGGRPFRFRFEDEENAALHLGGELPGAGLEEELASTLASRHFEGSAIRHMPVLSGYFDRNG